MKDVTIAKGDFQMGAVLSRGVAADGVMAWQDHQKPETFHYFPMRIDSVLGETLTHFKVTYYGISKQPYFQKITGDPTPQSVVGGVLSGQVVPDMTQAQRAAITEAITKQYEIQNLNLIPLIMRDVTVQPVFAQKLAEMGNGSSSTFGKVMQIGSQSAYSVSSGNSLFAEMVAREGSQGADSNNPDFAVNLVGKADFYGDPWQAHITCDLSKVWEYTRSQVDVGVQAGFFNLGVNVDKIAQSLITKNIVKIEYIEGGGGEEFGRQMLETTKKLFEEISLKAIDGEGLFKFEPNPTPQEPPKNDKWGASLLPWTISVNVNYASNFFKQEILFDQTISFTGKQEVLLTSAMSLATQCSLSTQRYFYDLQANEDGCITSEKRKGLQDRIGKEYNAKTEKLLEYAKKVEDGQWTVAIFKEMTAWLNTISLTEKYKPTIGPDGAEVPGVMSLEEALASIAEEEQARIAASLQRHAKAASSHAN
jgi:hypothetical protein